MKIAMATFISYFCEKRKSMTIKVKSHDIRGIIFDMDGTMVDNMMVHHRAWQRKLASLGLELTMEEVMEQIHGVNEEILERLFGGRFTAAERKRVAWEKEAEYRKIFKSELQLVKGLPALLDQLQNMDFPFGIGTAAPAENADFVLDELNIRSYFKAIVHAGHVSKGKPNPEVFQKAASGIGIPPGHCLVFEDSPTGIYTAQNAGCKAVAVLTTHQKEEFEQYDNVVGYINDFSKVALRNDGGGWHLSL
jgi:beta-phosphoglucomutase